MGYFGADARVKPLKEKRNATAAFPSFADMMSVAIDVIVEDWPEKMQGYKPTAGFYEQLKSGEVSEQKLTKEDPSLDSLTCSEMVNHILADFPAPGSLYYVLVNGLYLGEYGDYASCRVSTTNGKYILANV